MNLLLLSPLFLITLLFLVYYTYQDLKSREINVVPIFFVILFALLYLFLFVFRLNWYLWQFYFLQLGIHFLFISIIYILGRITVFAYIGEGDLYILTMIAFTSGFAVLFTPFVFLNALFFMLCIPILLLIYNLFKRNYKCSDYNFIKTITLMLLGLPKKVISINGFYTPLEKINIANDVINKQINLIPDCESETSLKNLKKVCKENKIKTIWVSPLIAFILPILLSYILTLVLFIFNIYYSLGPFSRFFF